MLDFEEVLFIFLQYAHNYDDSRTGIERKILHTFRVAKISRQIAAGLNLSIEEIELAWFLGILHDTGRFEQEKRFGTFVDRDSVDHAELGADILFCDGLIDRYPTDNLPCGWREICEKAVRLHNKLSLPEDLDDHTRLFCRIIRDADKADIFRVIATTTFEERVGTSLSRYTDADSASPEVMEYVYRHRCVPRKYIRSVFDSQICNCCMAFELDFDITRQIVKEQGFLHKMLKSKGAGAYASWNEKQLEELKLLQKELETAWGMPL